MLADLTSPGLLHDHQMLLLAREVAVGVFTVEEIRDRFKLSTDNWERIQRNPRFVAYLEEATMAWNTALNAQERIKVKGLTLIEEWLPEAYGHLSSPKETLRDKIELFKAMQKLTGIGERTLNGGDPSDRVSITINMGADNKLAVEKTFSQAPESLTIDHDPQDVL